MEMSKFESRADTPKLIDALEGLEMKEGPDFPQGDKTLRKADHQAFPREFMFEVVTAVTIISKRRCRGIKPSSRRRAHSRA